LGVAKKNRVERALSLLKYFGVDIQANKMPNELSGGQQQRVAISRALVNDPDILFADEPVGNLDSKSASDVMALLKRLNEKEHKTVILVTHNPAHLDIAHRIFYIKDGTLIKTKVNSAVNDCVAKEEEVSISKDLELLARTFSSITGSVGNLLIPFKAKQIVSEVLANMTSEEMGKIEKKVEAALFSGLEKDLIFDYFDDDPAKGGLGMNKKTAKRLADKINEIVEEIKILQESESKVGSDQALTTTSQVAEIRNYLFENFELKIKNKEIEERLESAIAARLKNEISPEGFCKILDLPAKSKGVGLDKRTANKVSKRLELLILGKYR